MKRLRKKESILLIHLFICFCVYGMIFDRYIYCICEKNGVDEMFFFGQYLYCRMNYLVLFDK